MSLDQYPRFERFSEIAGVRLELTLSKKIISDANYENAIEWLHGYR